MDDTPLVEPAVAGPGVLPELVRPMLAVPGELPPAAGTTQWRTR